MSMQFYLPESMYKLDSTINRENLYSLYECGVSVTGRVIRLNSKDKILEVDLGDNIIGIMRFEDATIYPVYDAEGVASPNVYKLVGKNIQAKIIGFDNTNIFVSRKLNMLEALEVLKNETHFEFAKITGFSRMSAFFDVGAGIVGRSNSKEFSNVKFRDIQDIGLQNGDIVPVSVIEYFNEDKRFELSRVDVLPSHNDYFSSGDTVTCKVFEPVLDTEVIGHYVLIDRTFCGIVDSPKIKLQYGDEIVAYVKKVKDAGLKLAMVEKID